MEPDYSTYPGKGWVWSRRLNKWRRPAMRAFMADRQGIHLVLGLAVGLCWLFLLVGNWHLTAATIAAQILAYLRFNRYEEVEAREISDDAYIDLGGEMVGWLIASVGVFGYMALRAMGWLPWL